jgi:hypothetical protein
LDCIASVSNNPRNIQSYRVTSFIIASTNWSVGSGSFSSLVIVSFITSFIIASTNWSFGSGSFSSLVIVLSPSCSAVVGPLLTSLESVESVDSSSVVSSIFSLGVIPCELSLPVSVSCELSVATLLLSNFFGAGVICAKTEF